jgi:uroporphyrinogen III methyltransferase/synthase
MPERHTRVVALTRARDDRDALAAVVALGVPVVAVPLVRRVAQPEEALAARIASGSHDGLVVTSEAAVEALKAACEGLGPRHPAVTAMRRRGFALWAVGPGTAAALAAALGRGVAEVAQAHHGRALAERMAESRSAIAGRRFLFPAAAGALRVVPEALTALGAEVDQVTCYVTEDDPAAAARVAEARSLGAVLWVLASPSAARALARALEDRVGGVEVAALGPTTAEAARSLGFSVCVEASKPTMAALAEAVEAFLRAG